MTQLPGYVSEHRQKAAELSGGISSDAIYSAIERIIAERKLAGSILDYGAGLGNLTRRLLASGRFDRVAAVDLMGVPADLVNIIEWREQDLNVPTGHEGEFDVVVAAEVIEHLENPRYMMREIFRVLRPGGTAIISTPNNESWRSLLAMLVRGHYVAFSDSCYPAHITALVRKDIVRIFEEARFRTPQFYFTDQGGIPGKPNLLWQQISLGLLRGLRFSDNIVAVARKSEAYADRL